MRLRNLAIGVALGLGLGLLIWSLRSEPHVLEHNYSTSSRTSDEVAVVVAQEANATAGPETATPSVLRTLSGQILDDKGKPLAYAEVWLARPEHSFAPRLSDQVLRLQTTDESGSFAWSDLPPDKYSLTATAPGFQTCAPMP